MTGKLLTLDRGARADAARPARAARRAGRRPGVAGARSAAAPPADARRRQAPAPAGEPGAAAAAGLRGPALDRRRDAGAARQPGREPADARASCCWSTTGRSTSTAGAARPTTRSSASTRCRPRAPSELLAALLGDRRQRSSRSSRCSIERTEGNPFFLEESVRTLVETGVLAGERGAYRLARPLDSIAGARPRCRRCSPRASTGCRPRTSGCSRRRP